MRIVCPHCAAVYDVPEDRLLGRSTLRCASCGQSWALEPALEPELPAEPVAEPARNAAPDAPSTLARPPEPAPDAASAPHDGAIVLQAPQPLAPPLVQEPADRMLPGAWAGSVVLLVALLAALLIWHEPLARAWPPLQRLYGLVGLAPAGQEPCARGGC